MHGVTLYGHDCNTLMHNTLVSSLYALVSLRGQRYSMISGSKVVLVVSLSAHNREREVAARVGLYERERPRTISAKSHHGLWL